MDDFTNDLQCDEFIPDEYDDAFADDMEIGPDMETDFGDFDTCDDADRCDWYDDVQDFGE